MQRERVIAERAWGRHLVTVAKPLYSTIERHVALVECLDGTQVASGCLSCVSLV
jgi:hypothetical protein